MNKPSNWWSMDYTERKEWERSKQAIKDAEYDRWRAERDAEDARLQAQQARQNYQQYMASHEEEESYLIADIENKDAQIEAMTERIAELEAFAQKFLDNFEDCICDQQLGLDASGEIHHRCQGTGKQIDSRGVLYVELPDEARALLGAK